MKKLKVGLLCNEEISRDVALAIAAISGFQLTGISGISKPELVDLPQVSNFADPELLIENSDAIILMVSSDQQFELAKMALKNSKHLFIEEPLVTEVKKAEVLLSMQREADVKVQVGCGLRLNSSFLSWGGNNARIQFLETRNLTNTHSEIPVVLELMLPDLDFVLHLAKSEVRKISASGVSLSGNTPDMVNARLEFGNGCVASLTVNSKSNIHTHAAGVFENGASVVFDFSSSENPQMPSSASGFFAASSTHHFSNPLQRKKPTEILVKELKAFYSSIVRDSITMVPLSDACRALKVAQEIMEKIEERGMEG